LSAGYNGQIRKSKNDVKNSTANVICGVLLVNSMTASAAITWPVSSRAQVMTGSGFPVRAGCC